MSSIRLGSWSARGRARAWLAALAVAAVGAPARAQEAQAGPPSVEPMVEPMVEPTAPPTAPPSPPPSAPARPAEQAPRDPKEDADGMGQFLLGAGVFDFEELNDRLAAAGYERFDDVLTLIGGEGHAVLQSGFVIGARGAALLAPSADGPDEVRARLSGGFGMLDLGFALVDTRSVLCTLTAGIGGYGLTLDIADERSATFDAVLRAPRRGTSLSTGGLLGALTLGFDGRVQVGKPDERGHRGFFTLGVRAGVLYGPPISSWNIPDDTEATSGPSSALLGAYTAVVVGFGGGRAR